MAHSAAANEVATHAIFLHKTNRPIKFEITLVACATTQTWIKLAELRPEHFLFFGWLHDSPDLGTLQYFRIHGHWVDELGPKQQQDFRGESDGSASDPARCSARGAIDQSYFFVDRHIPKIVDAIAASTSIVIRSATDRENRRCASCHCLLP